MADLIHKAITLEDIGKRYQIGREEATYATLREAIVRQSKAPFRRLGKLLKGGAYGASDLDESIWAVRDVTFSVNEGEVVGIIGRNGAGKSTLLKILARITEPTEGRAVINGRVASLLEVGTGFHPELTGRENIFLNGSILGMQRTEIEQNYDEIVNFSGVQKFIDTPVKHYSSGMRVRLAFSVAAHLEPEILLVDEVLSVGDAAFQKKSLGKMGGVAQSGRTVLFVSHNMGAISQMCSRALWIDNGALRMDGDPEKVVSSYLMENSSDREGIAQWPEGVANPGVAEFEFKSVKILDENETPSSIVDSSRPLWIEMQYTLLTDLPIVQVGVRIHSTQGGMVLDAFDIDDQRFAGARKSGDYVCRCEIPGQLLNSGRYVLSLYASITKVKILAHIQDALVFDVEHSRNIGAHGFGGRKPQGAIHPKQLSWEQNSTPLPKNQD